jgi:hypothetical protein
MNMHCLQADPDPAFTSLQIWVQIQKANPCGSGSWSDFAASEKLNFTLSSVACPKFDNFSYLLTIPVEIMPIKLLFIFSNLTLYAFNLEK